jgi:hypothetical protein
VSTSGGKRNRIQNTSREGFFQVRRAAGASLSYPQQPVVPRRATVLDGGYAYRVVSLVNISLRMRRISVQQRFWWEQTLTLR